MQRLFILATPIASSRAGHFGIAFGVSETGIAPLVAPLVGSGIRAALMIATANCADGLHPLCTPVDETMLSVLQSPLLWDGLRCAGEKSAAAFLRTPRRAPRHRGRAVASAMGSR